MNIDESLDIGMVSRTPVDNGYQLPFRFTGKIDKLTYEIRPEQLTAAESRNHGADARQGARLRKRIFISAVH